MVLTLALDTAPGKIQARETRTELRLGLDGSGLERRHLLLSGPANPSPDGTLECEGSLRAKPHNAHPVRHVDLPAGMRVVSVVFGQDAGSKLRS